MCNLIQIGTVKDSRDEFIHEANLLDSLRHPNVVTFFGSFVDMNSRQNKALLFEVNPTRICLVTEFSPFGSLNSFLVDKTFSTEQLCGMVKDAAQGMLYLHSKNILHR